LQFSRPMDSALTPRATLGRDAQLSEVTLSAVGESEGWQRTSYANDTWIGETVLFDDGNLTSSWRLAISATDPFGLKLDAAPDTIATYTAGMSQWENYEDTTGIGSGGGIDTRHSIGPGVRGDFPSILVAAPGPGERLAGGDDYKVTWTGPNAPGFPQSLSLSTDGGVSFTSLAENIPSDAQSYRVVMPRVSTTQGRIQLLATEPVSRNFMVAVSQADFSIGINVGSNMDVSFVSSEKVDLNWADTSSDEPPSTASGASRLIINLRIANRGNTPIVNPFLHVAEMNRHVLLTRNPKSKWSEGACLNIDAGDDNTLSPGETADARLVVGLVSPKKFYLSVDVYGVPGEQIIPSSAVTVWTGKPRTR
jgi:urease beta subunit